MVFGLATKKEIRKINKLKDFPEYCDGHTELSKIQYLVSNNKRIVGQISSKSILTPYSFTCDKSYHIDASFLILNLESHIDYRCQDMKILSLVFAILVSVVLISFFIYSIIRCCSENKHQLCFLLVFVLALYTAKNFISFTFWNRLKQKGSEYLYEKKTYRISSDFIDIGDSIGLMLIEVFTCIFIATIPLSNAFFHSSKCLFKFLTLMATSLALIYIFIAYFGYGSRTNLIVSSVFFLSFLLFLTLVKPFFSVTKIGFYVYLVGAFVTFSLYYLFEDMSQETIGVHYLLIILEIVSILTQSLSIILMLVGMIYLNEYNLPSEVKKDPVYPAENEYNTIRRGDIIDPNSNMKYLLASDIIEPNSLNIIGELGKQNNYTNPHSNI